MKFCVRLLAVLLVLVTFATQFASCSFPWNQNNENSNTTENNVVIIPPNSNAGNDNGNDLGNTVLGSLAAPYIADVHISASVDPDEGNKVPVGGVSIEGATASATVPGGVQMEVGANELALTINGIEKSEADVSLSDTEVSTSLDVHVEGVAVGNLVPMEIKLQAAAIKGLNSTSIRLYHVENGKTIEMALVSNNAPFSAHNQFKYDPITGDVTVYIASFSEIAIISDTENAWDGTRDYSWYDASKTELVIANAEQLAGFSAIVGGMDNQTKDNFAGKTVKLIADINLGDAERENDPDKIFYPIGYYNNEGTYEKSSNVITSNVSAFRGTFDGNGHTISNFFQSTLEMKGDSVDYDATLQHYNDAMGLFGYVFGATIKNLTVDNFSSAGENTPTGVIAAYAVASKFENIAIKNCNPRVYNSGNGGIIGIAGREHSAVEAIELTNITVDSTNKIGVLNESCDVACGGLVGMYRGNANASGSATGDTIIFKNCNVSAQLDVYNDVCSNYQYGSYRYSGMLIGSIRHNTTSTEGKVIPNMAGVEAYGCTVNFSSWNYYFYCEFEANTMASQSGDYQFSRVPHSELNFIDTNGNGIVDTEAEKDSVTGCKHSHTAAEDKQAVYLEFDNLFAGYGWGISSMGINRWNGVNIEDVIEINEGTVENSVQKFESTGTTMVGTGSTITLDKLFKEITGNTVAINSENVVVTISPVDTSATVSAVYNMNTSDWKQSTLSFSGIGKLNLTITDYYFCESTTIQVDVVIADKFDTKLTGDFTYRIGNQNTVALGLLFKQKDGTPAVDSTSVSVTATNGTFTANTNDWTKATLNFAGYTGLATIAIKDSSSTEYSIQVEIVDGVNASSAQSVKTNNVVLLNDVGFSTIEVSGGYTLYGNGFKMTAANDVMYDAMGVGFVTLKNGTLDNVQIVCPNFSFAILYSSQIKDANNTAKPSDSSNDARGNVRSAVIVDGNSKIINSYIHGGRAAIYLRSGNLVIDGSTISGGAVANIHAVSAQSLTLEDVTLIQKPFQATVHDTSKTLMGFSVLLECDENGTSTPIILEGNFVQDAWVNKEYSKYAPSAASSIINTALSKTAYLHDIDGDGTNESLNLGFTHMPQALGSKVSVNVTDNRTNKNSVPYETVEVSGSHVFSYKNTNGTIDEFKNVADYVPFAQGPTAPTVSFTDTNAEREFSTVFDTSDNRWESTLTIDLKSNYNFSFDKLLAQKHGQSLSYTVKTADGTVIDTSKVITLSQTGTTEYILTVVDGDATHTIYFIIAATKKEIPAPEVVNKVGADPLLVVKSKNSDWSCAVPALEGIKVKYYTADGNEVILDLATLTPTSTGKQNGTNNYWETTKDGYSLKITSGYIHEGKQVYGMPVVVDNNGTKQMYFTISSTSGYVSTGTSARAVTLTYEFTDPNGKSVKFTVSWTVTYADYKDKAQYSYSDFVDGKMTDLLTSSSSGGGNCVTPETLITLADGTQVRVDSLTGNEMLLVWNMETGKLDAAPIMFLDSDPTAEYEVIRLYFSDGTSVNVISEHGFWDYDLNRYVYLDKNAADYIGHTFAKQNGDTLEKVQLVDVVIETETTTAWSPVTVGHLCYFVNGMLSMPGGVGGLFNIFEVDPETMTYDYEQIAKDIETYGLFTYEELNAICPLSEDMFNAAGGAYLKISIGKGNLTMEELVAMITRYSKYI